MLCQQSEERIDHLLIGCSLSRQVWFACFSKCGWQHLTPQRDERLVNWWLRVRKAVAKAHHGAFDSLVILVDWSLRLQRNDRVFNKVSMSEAAVASSIFMNLELWIRAKLVVRSQILGD
jgi:hypothetical protein